MTQHAVWLSLTAEPAADVVGLSEASCCCFSAQSTIITGRMRNTRPTVIPWFNRFSNFLCRVEKKCGREVSVRCVAAVADAAAVPAVALTQGHHESFHRASPTSRHQCDQKLLMLVCQGMSRVHNDVSPSTGVAGWPKASPLQRFPSTPHRHRRGVVMSVQC